MNSSANLISLSDSGLTSSFSSSSAVGTTNHGGKDRSLLTDTPCNKNKSALLIDFTDEIQEPQAILTLAENDDTFGIFNKAPPSHPRVKEVIESDEASKPVRPFTLGRKSHRTKIDSCLETQEDNASVDKQAVNEKKNDSGDGGSTSESEQPTIVEGADDDDEECLSPITQGKDEEGITDQNMVATLSCNSGASDSDILDINNLSSFSIPEADYDDNEFLENIKKEVPASSAILDEIRYQIMQEQESNESKDQNLLSNMSRPSTMSRTSISSHNTVKFSSPPPRAPNSNRLSTVSTISSIQGDDDDTDAHFSRAKCRLSGILSSPIRASYPVSKYYMPTPKAMTPNPKGSVREKFSQSFCSPNMTRLVVTGNARRSPSRVPVRKSISAETLHYEFSSPARNRNATQTLLKFSTPSAPSRARDFAGFQTTFLNDRHMNVEENNKDNNLRSTFNKGDPFALEADNFRVPRYGRLSSTSRASSSSTTSINTLSPTGSTSSMSRKDISDVVRQMKQMRLNDTSNSTSSKANRTTKAPASTALVQPMKATAIIPPSNASIIESRTNPVTNKPHGLTVTSSTEKRKFIPPIAASSPKTAPSPTRPVSQTTPSRTRYHSNVKSSGYGPGAQDLNASFGTKPPLQSPNSKISSSLTAMKPPAIPKSLGTRLQFAAKTELPRLGSKTVRTAMPPPKIPTISASATGIRRPASGTSTTNKENNTRTIGLKTGASTRPRQ
ncbi:unnamed protein product [Orchesella dallaii]|uniref:Uncharacterized protein n=1 Tax=Orchesella dallaii TaxID=48710 RepID=A0ABP1RCR2_9HEXA